MYHTRFNAQHNTATNFLKQLLKTLSKGVQL